VHISRAAATESFVFWVSLRSACHCRISGTTCSSFASSFCADYSDFESASGFVSHQTYLRSEFEHTSNISYRARSFQPGSLWHFWNYGTAFCGLPVQT
jgi:hypothetical protein